MLEKVKVFEQSHVVTDAEAIHFMGPDAVPVLSTPSMIGWIEYACRDNASSLLKPGEDTVGISVDIKHLAATPVGMQCRVVSRLTQIEGRVYTFEVEVFDENEKVGEGIHKRASVSVEKFSTRVAAKRDTVRHAR